MSREYSKVSPRFWTGDTGRQLRKMGHECQVVALYLITCPHANMLGLYYLSLPTLCHEIGSPLQGASKALRRLSEGGFAHYDQASEHVFVPNMAREQIGERLSRKDNRHKAVIKELENLRKSPFFNDFISLYRVPFDLPYEVPSEGASKALRRGLQDPPNPLRSQEQEQEQEQEKEQKQEQEQKQLDVEFGNSTDRTPDDPADRVFDHWRKEHDHPRAKLDPKRRKLIEERLADYSEADLCQSISGYRNSPHHMGTDPKGNGTKYDDIGLFMRDGTHVDRGLKLYQEPPRSDLSVQTRRIIEQTKDWVPPEMRTNAGD